MKTKIAQSIEASIRVKQQICSDVDFLLRIERAVEIMVHSLCNGGKIHFLKYENGSLRVEESLDLDGFAYDTSCTSRGILIPQVLPSGQTVLTEIYR